MKTQVDGKFLKGEKKLWQSKIYGEKYLKFSREIEVSWIKKSANASIKHTTSMRRSLTHSHNRFRRQSKERRANWKKNLTFLHNYIKLTFFRWRGDESIFDRLSEWMTTSEMRNFNFSIVNHNFLVSYANEASFRSFTSPRKKAHFTLTAVAAFNIFLVN